MRLFIPFLFFLLTLLFYSCEGPAPGGQTENESNDSSAVDTREYANTSPTLRANHDCEIQGKFLEGNKFWVREKEILLCVLADSATYDPDYGDSHRIIEVYDTKSCQLIERKVLPVSVSPDFPYYLAEITYNNSSQIVAIRGFDRIYCYDLKSKKMLPELTPKFLSERFGVDAQSGMIQRLEVWEDYLIGYAQDFGTFVFDLSAKKEARPVLAFAEFASPDENYSSLFLLPSAGASYQAIIPVYDIEENKFSINPLFEQPKALNTNIPKSARNNRYLVIRQTDEARIAIAIDLQRRQTLDLPSGIASGKTQEILNWIKQNN